MFVHKYITGTLIEVKKVQSYIAWMQIEFYTTQPA